MFDRKLVNYAHRLDISRSEPGIGPSFEHREPLSREPLKNRDVADSGFASQRLGLTSTTGDGRSGTAQPSASVAEPRTRSGVTLAGDHAEASTQSAIEGSARSLGSQIRLQLGDELLAVEQLIASALASRYAEVQSLANRAAAMGGKRLRPMLLLLFAQAARDSDLPMTDRQRCDARRAAAAVELVHAASLVHDDVMDAATERRHQATIGHACGNEQAVLLGDFLFTRAYAMAAQCSRSIVARRLADAATQLCEGELRQQASAGNWRLKYATYRSILNQKTGALTGVSCRLGCSIGNAPTSRQRAADRFGSLLGLAFQIFDDWLDYWGDGERVGKTLGTDLNQLKPTLPLMRLLRTSPPGERRVLIAMLERKDPQAFGEVQRALEQSDAKSFTLESARRCIELAKLQLQGFKPSPALECIQAIADFSVQRKF